MTTVLLVALGSACGGVARYLVSTPLNVRHAFPWGTLAVNVLGALILGALSGFLSRFTGNGGAVRAFAVVGFCGGFTTFSTFSNEAFLMAERSAWGMLAVYLAVSTLAGLAAVAIGVHMSR